MPGMERLHLQDALDDNPQTRNLLGVFEKDASMVKQYTIAVNNCCQRILNAQNELCSATQSLSHMLKAYEKQKFPLDNDDSVLSSTLTQFSKYLDELSSVHKILATQLADSMMYPLNKFLQADLEEITTVQEMCNITASEHENAVSRYMKLPKKKENEKARADANEDLYVYRKKYHQTSLHYYAALNALQYKRKYSLLEPIVGYLHAQKSFFDMGHETISKSTDLDEFLSNISVSCQGVRQEMGVETQKTVELVQSIEKQSAHLYYAEPPADMPYIPPNTQLVYKAGYLMIRSKTLLGNKWDRHYFFTQGGNLMSQTRDEVAGSLVLDFNEHGTHAEPTDIDDRRFVFQIVSPMSKKVIHLQAENDREKDEWVAAINNIMKESLYMREKPRPKERASSNSSSGSHSGSHGSHSGSHGSHSGSHGSSSVAVKSERTSDEGPATPPPSPAGQFTPDAPIQFDLLTPTEESVTFGSPPREGPPKRINPFDQSTVTIKGENVAGNSSFSQSYEVRFLGSMAVKADKGESLISDTIRQIVTARAIHNVFKMIESHLIITTDSMRLLDPATNALRTEFGLEDVSYWSAHKENRRLFGFITRTKGSGRGDLPTFACHVFECNTSGEEICQGISSATKLAFQALMEKKANEKEKSKEKAILLENLVRCGDKLDEPQLSPDGKYVILDNNQSVASPQSPGFNYPTNTANEEDADESEA